MKALDTLYWVVGEHSWLWIGAAGLLLSVSDLLPKNLGKCAVFFAVGLLMVVITAEIIFRFALLVLSHSPAPAPCSTFQACESVILPRGGAIRAFALLAVTGPILGIAVKHPWIGVAMSSGAVILMVVFAVARRCSPKTLLITLRGDDLVAISRMSHKMEFMANVAIQRGRIIPSRASLEVVANDRVRMLQLTNMSHPFTLLKCVRSCARAYGASASTAG